MKHKERFCVSNWTVSFCRDTEVSPEFHGYGSASIYSLYRTVSPFNHLHVDLRQHESDMLTEYECSLVLLSLRGKHLQCHLTSCSSSCWKDESCARLWLLMFSNYPPTWCCSVFLCGRASVHPFLLAPFGKLIHFLLKCLNNYSDIEVNCLISIAMEASCWNPHTICSRNSSQKILCYQRGCSDLNQVFSFLFFFLHIQHVGDRELRYTVDCH